jgi:low temperature requirement protein LtrA
MSSLADRLMTRNGNQVRGLDPEYTSPAGAAERQPAFLLVMALWWAWEDLNLGPHPER